MGFNDILKKSFIEGYFASDISTTESLITLGVTFVLGLYVYGVYRIISRKSFYSKSFHISLVAMAILTAGIILTIQSSVVISLGMVGALSIVRFRTAIKDPMDLIFLFWTIALGIMCGAGLFELALIVSLVVTVVMVILECVPSRRESLLLVVHANESSNIDKEVLDIVRKYAKYYRTKSRNLTMSGFDMIVEVQVRDEELFLQDLNALGKLSSISLLSHDGEVTY